MHPLWSIHRVRQVRLVRQAGTVGAAGLCGVFNPATRGPTVAAPKALKIVLLTGRVVGLGAQIIPSPYATHVSPPLLRRARQAVRCGRRCGRRCGWYGAQAGRVRMVRRDAQAVRRDAQAVRLVRQGAGGTAGRRRCGWAHR